MEQFNNKIKDQDHIISKSKKIRKLKEERVYVKSNKGTKIELKNLDQLKLIEKSGELDEWTTKKLSEIKNLIFKNNVFDIEKKMIVSSIRLLKISKLNRTLTPMVWEYYKNRGNLDVNQIIIKYSRDNLKINYLICSKRNKEIVVINDE
jgi:hypothetical protein